MCRRPVCFCPTWVCVCVCGGGREHSEVPWALSGRDPRSPGSDRTVSLMRAYPQSVGGRSQRQASPYPAGTVTVLVTAFWEGRPAVDGCCQGSVPPGRRRSWAAGSEEASATQAKRAVQILCSNVWSCHFLSESAEVPKCPWLPCRPPSRLSPASTGRWGPQRWSWANWQGFWSPQVWKAVMWNVPRVIQHRLTKGEMVCEAQTCGREGLGRW